MITNTLLERVATLNAVSDALFDISPAAAELDRIRAESFRYNRFGIASAVINLPRVSRRTVG